MKKLIAITGKIGSGKTSVLVYLKQKGYEVLSADLIYKELLETDEKFVEQICSALNVAPLIYQGKKMIDRIAIKQAVFTDKEKLNLLNQTTHPKIMQELINKAKKSEGIVFCEIPLLAEALNAGLKIDLDGVWEVVRDNSQRLSSVADRDEVSLDFAQKITQNQKNYEKTNQTEHTFIYNDGTIDDLYKKVDALEKNL